MRWWMKHKNKYNLGQTFLHTLAKEPIGIPTKELILVPKFQPWLEKFTVILYQIHVF